MTRRSSVRLRPHRGSLGDRRSGAPHTTSSSTSRATNPRSTRRRCAPCSRRSRDPPSTLPRWPRRSPDETARTSNAVKLLGARASDRTACARRYSRGPCRRQRRRDGLAAYRRLCLPARGAGALRRAAAVGERAARAARTIARARRRHADRRRAGRTGPARRRYARRSRRRACAVRTEGHDST